MSWWEYVRKPSAAENRQRAVRAGQRLVKRGRQLSPVLIDGRTIARSFWGKAWCDNLESYRDYEYRLPRGRSYLRNGAVLDLRVTAGSIAALVSGTALYEVKISIKPLAKAHWGRLKGRCAGEVGSLIELLEGRLSDRVMRLVTHRDEGLFPRPAEIQLDCSCPDWATMCKHVAAVMYGVGARLDREPELLFVLRAVDHGELITGATDIEVARRSPGRKTIAEQELSSVFGIELAETTAPPSPAAPPAPPSRSRKLPRASARAAAAPAPAAASRPKNLKPKNVRSKKKRQSSRAKPARRPAAGR